MTFLHVSEKFDGDFIFKGSFDSVKSRAHKMLLPLHNKANWL
jgi:hypothetical protein